MIRLQELRQQRDTLVQSSRTLIEKNPGDKWKAEHTAQYDAMLADIEKIDGEIKSIINSQSNGVAAPHQKWRASDGRELQIMRGAADFQRHYGAKMSNSTASGREPEPTLADFVRGVAGMRSTPAIQNALSVGTNSAGGFTVPSLVMPGILEALVPASSLLTAGAGIVDLGEGAKSFTTAAINAIPSAAWRNEGASVAESDPTFRAVSATPQSLAFYFKISRELLSDSPNVEEALRTAIAQSFARELDRVGLRGTGTAPQPRGLLNTAGIQSVTNGANGAALAGYANFFTAVQAILSADAPAPTAAIMHPRSLVKLSGLLDSTNQPLNVPPMLAPMRMLTTSQIPTNLSVGTSNDCSEIYLGDFTRCAFMLRENISIQLVNELFALTGELGFVCHVRADFACWYPAAFAVVTGVRP